MSITATIQDALAGELTSILQKATRKHKLTLEWKTSYWWGPFRDAAGQIVIGKGSRFDTKAAAVEAARRIGAAVTEHEGYGSLTEAELKADFARPRIYTPQILATDPSRPPQEGARSGRALVVYATQTMERLGKIPVTDETRAALDSVTPPALLAKMEDLHARLDPEAWPAGASSAQLAWYEMLAAEEEGEAE